MVGNRVLAAGDVDRLKTVLASATGAKPEPDPRLVSAHEAAKLDGEDAWAFSTQPAAAASFDVNDRDELAFRIGVVEPGLAIGRDECLSIVSMLLPKIPADVFTLDEPAEQPTNGVTMCTGRIEGLS